MKAMIARGTVVGVFCLGVIASRDSTSALAGGAPFRAAASNARFPTWQVLATAHTIRGLSRPEGVAIDLRGRSVSKWMYVADTGKNRVIKMGTGGHYLGGWGSRGTGPGQFENPSGVAVDARGDVYVADAGNNRVEKFGPHGRFLAQWGTKGSSPGQFNDPTGIAVGGSGNVFVADRVNLRIEKFSQSGRLLAVWPVFMPKGPDPAGLGPAGPYALTVNTGGDVHSAVDTGQCSGGHCVMDYIVLETLSPSGKVIRSIVGGNPYGPYSYQPVTGITGRGPWWQIGALAAGPRHSLFLGELNPDDRASITELSSAEKRGGQWELPKPSGVAGWVPHGMALARGNVYVADTLANRMLKLAP